MYIVSYIGVSVFCSWNCLTPESSPHGSQGLQGSELNAPQKKASHVVIHI